MLNRNKESVAKNNEELNKAMELIKALEAKSVETENDISELKSDTEALRMNLTLSNNRHKSLKEKVDDILKSLKELKDDANRAPISDGSGIDPKQLDKFYASK